MYGIREADIVGVQTAINLAILNYFADTGLEFAFPTQTVFTIPSPLQDLQA